jgi:hypothetical protein
MKDNPKPWDLEPSLEENRLRALAGLIMTISNECTDLHDEAAGDSLWTLGCRIYGRVCNRLLRLSATREWSWLRVERQRTDLEISLMVGRCLIRYFRGDADNPNQMQLIRAEEMQRAFGNFIDNPDDSFNWFIVLEKDDRGRAVQAVVVQANSDGKTRYPWIAATTDRSNGSVTVQPIGKAPVDVPRPIITAKDTDEKIRTGSNDR